MFMTTDHQSLLQLMTWLSPVFPTGGFSYSHGLEAAIGDGLVESPDDLSDWIVTLISRGSLWNDCVLLVEATRQSDAGEIRAVSRMAEALAGSCERNLETMSQGAAFLAAARGWCDGKEIPDQIALPVAVGALCSINDIDIEVALVAFLNAFASNQIQAALRLMKLGQQNGVWVQQQLEQAILMIAKRACQSTLDDLGSATVIAEIAAMKHETMNSRIFRT